MSAQGEGPGWGEQWVISSRAPMLLPSSTPLRLPRASGPFLLLPSSSLQALGKCDKCNAGGQGGKQQLVVVCGSNKLVRRPASPTQATTVSLAAQCRPRCHTALLLPHRLCYSPNAPTLADAPAASHSVYFLLFPPPPPPPPPPPHHCGRHVNYPGQGAARGQGGGRGVRARGGGVGQGLCGQHGGPHGRLGLHRHQGTIPGQRNILRRNLIEEKSKFKIEQNMQG